MSSRVTLLDGVRHSLSAIDVSTATTDADLEDVIAVWAVVAPDLPADLPHLQHMLDFWDAIAFLVARIDGRPVGAALVGVFPGTSGQGLASGDVSVPPAVRRRGVGTELLRRISERARSLGKEELLVEAREDDPESIGWLERRGYTEIERQKWVALELTASAAPRVEPPPGIAIVSRAERPDLLDGMFEVAREANADIPGLDSMIDWTFDEWKAFEIDRPSRPPELTFLALEGETVVGRAATDVIAGQASLGLTAVRRSHRRRGIARALKLAQIRAAKEAGYPRLLTENEETNEPIRRLNESLGYRPVPGNVVFRGPLAAG